MRASRKDPLYRTLLSLGQKESRHTASLATRFPTSGADLHLGGRALPGEDSPRGARRRALLYTLQIAIDFLDETTMGRHGSFQRPNRLQLCWQGRVGLLEGAEQGRPLNLSEFVDGSSSSLGREVRFSETLLFSRDWPENGEERHRVSVSIDELQIAIN